MAEEYQPKSFEERLAEDLKKEEEMKRRMEQVRTETEERLKTDPQIQEFFSNYNPIYIPGFISSYANSKTYWMEWGDSYREIGENNLLAYQEKSQWLLECIQLKKLYDLFLQWNANLIKLDGVLCSWDLSAWAHNLFNCPFLTPIDHNEFEMMLQFTRIADFDPDQRMDWIDFAEWWHETESEPEELLPEWFLFHNLHTGNQRFLLLTKLRTDKEEFYRNLNLEAKYESGEYQRQVPDERPQISPFDRKTLEDFIRRFEDKKVLEKFLSMEQYSGIQTYADFINSNEGWLNDMAMEIPIHMKEIKEKIPVEANDDWRMALVLAWKKYEATQIREGLTAAYEDYLFHLENNIAFETPDEFTEHLSMAENVRKQILKGRELNGEAPNFEY